MLTHRWTTLLLGFLLAVTSLKAQTQDKIEEPQFPGGRKELLKYMEEHMVYPAKEFDGQFFVELYLPARTAIVLKEGRIRKGKSSAKKSIK